MAFFKHKFQELPGATLYWRRTVTFGKVFPTSRHEIGATITCGKIVYMRVTGDGELVPLTGYPIMRLFVT